MIHCSALSMGKFVKGLPVQGKRKVDNQSTSNVTTTKTTCLHQTQAVGHDKK